MKEKFDFDNWWQSFSNKYQPMSIDEFKNEVLPYETMDVFYTYVEQYVKEKKIDLKDIDTLINILKIGKLKLSKPQHDKDKTKVANKISAEYLQNLIEYLELQKSRNPNISIPPEGKKAPDRYYALLYQILVYLGKEPQIGNKTKAEIIDFGKQKYGTGQGFYREIRSIDLNNMTAFVRSLQKNDRCKWRETIITISGNDADVISWVNKQPK